MKITSMSAAVGPVLFLPLGHTRGRMNSENEDLKGELEALKQENESLKNNLESQKGEVELQRQETEAQKWKIKTLELEKLSLLENDEWEILHTPHGNLFNKTILGNDHSVFKIAHNKDTSSMMTEEAEKIRKSLNHMNIVKFHHSYLEEEGSITQLFGNEMRNRFASM